MLRRDWSRGRHDHDFQPPPDLSRSYSETIESPQYYPPPRLNPSPHRDERHRRRQSFDAQSTQRHAHNRGNYADPGNRRLPSRSRSRSRSAARYADLLERVRASELKWADIKPSYIQRITMMYYDGEGTRAWRLKYQERAGFHLTPPPADPRYPDKVKFVCYVTVKGKRIISNEKLYYEIGQDDKSLARLLNEGYESIRKGAPWALSRFLSLKSIGAVEFQTWKQFADDRRCLLSNVESIPKEANRTSMSVFAYQLQNPGNGYNWTGQFDKIVQEACQIHVNAPDKYLVLVHIVETLNMRILYIAFTGALAFSIAGGTTYGGLTAHWGEAFTLAGFLLAACSFICALVALPEALGIEVPIFSTRNMYALDAREVTELLESGHLGP